MAHSKDCKFKFSVITGVYNVRSYLPEMIESIVRQSIGFKENIELILVDDGSTDGSEKICDEYAAKFPNNIKVFHKANGGVSSARNVGMKIADGKYLNFCDADDKFAKNAFAKVWKFFERHEGEIDVACVPVFLFERERGEHYLNAKFKKGDRIIDLNQEPQMSLLQVNSSFFSSKIKAWLRFDERLSVAEDVTFVSMVLMEKLKFGVVTGTKYFYRKRNTKDSAIDVSATVESYYDSAPKYFLEHLRAVSVKKFGKVPRFLQYALLGDLLWRIKQPENKMYYYGKDNEKHLKYLEMLSSMIHSIESEVIAKSGRLGKADKLFLVNKVKGEKIKVVKNLLGENPNLKFYFKDTMIFDASGNTELTLHFFETLEGKAKITLSICCPTQLLIYDPYIKCNGKYYLLERIEKAEISRRLGKVFSENRFYEVSVDLKDVPLKFSFAICVDGKFVELKNLQYGKYFPLSDLRKSYVCFDKLVLTHGKKGGFVIDRCGRLSKLRHEILYDLSIIKNRPVKNHNINLKIVILRLYDFLFHGRKNKWIITDRINKAGDNGEALFRYAMTHGSKQKHIKFAVSKESKDFKRLRAEFDNIINISGTKYYLDFLVSDFVISSHADAHAFRPLGNQNYLNDILWHKKMIFLQHGVISNDISNWLNRYKNKFDGFVVSSREEYDLVHNQKAAYHECEVWLTGLPRFDLLHEGEKKYITIMPTWRKYLSTGMDKRTGIWEFGENFTSSTYYKFYNALLNDQKLIDYCKSKGYQLAFMPHPNIIHKVELFEHNKDVKFFDISTGYAEVFSQSAMVLTDYSSVVFDFANLMRPILYCHFDKDEISAQSHVYNLTKDYEKTGFGEVCKDLKETTEKIREYVKNNCKMKEKYRKRIENYFEFNDKDNCKRVYDRIMLMEKKKGD